MKTMNKGLYECHGHLMMDGVDYIQAKRRHEHGVQIERIRQDLECLKDAGVTYFRDGGDALGVSAAAREIAPEYGIEYVTPLFAIHKKGRYGGIVGYAYSDRNEYTQLVKRVRSEGGNFIKIMISGIITFAAYGELSCPSLSEEEIKDLVHIAHDAGFAVMAHSNGNEAVRAAVNAGVDSIEHGAFLNDETVAMLAESKTVWVPTAAAIAAFTKRDGIDRGVADLTLKEHLRSISLAAGMGAMIAAGSDSGAAGVPHGSGTKEEYRLLAGISKDVIDKGNARIAELFHR